MSASSRSLHNTQEVAAMTRSLPEHEVLRYLSHGHPLPAAEGSSITNNTFRYTALFIFYFACTGADGTGISKGANSRCSCISIEQIGLHRVASECLCMLATGPDS